MVTRAAAALLAERIARQGIVTRPCRSVAEAAALTVAVQAQDNAASRLGIRARAAAVSEADVLGAIDARQVTRTWLMRGTIHLVDTADLPWLVRLIGPSVIRKYRTRWRQIGLADDLLDRSLDVLPAMLADGPLTRHEISTGLAERGVVFDSPDAQAHTHVVVHACTTGLLCRAPDRGRDSTFTMLDEWVGAAPRGPSGDDALAALARRYFGAFSPATAADFTTWSGLASGRAVELIRDELDDADVDGRPGFRLGTVEPARGLRLLPGFDNYVLGYRDRRALLGESLHEHVYVGGIIRPTIVVNGRIAGTWSIDRAGSSLRATLRPFGSLSRTAVRAAERDIDDVGRFLGRPASVVALEPY